ncbi:MAG: ATP-binding cassette domain-containing protein [Fenollaria timonensis]
MNEVKTVTELVKKKKPYTFIDSNEDLLYAVDEGEFSYIDGTKINFPAMKFNKNGLYIFKGSSGSGKSTILTVLYNSFDMEGWSPQINTHISKTEDFTKIAAISLKDGVFLGNSIEEVLNIKDKAKLNDLLRSMAMPELEKIYDREDFNSLSGGERDLLLIIRALVSDPLLVFLDEPGASLDAKNKEKLFEFIKKDSKKRTYILAYHDNYLDEYADKLYIVKDASVKESQNEDDI